MLETSQSPTAQTLSQDFSPLISLVTGDPKRSATSVCSQHMPVRDALVYVSDPEIFKQLLDSPVSLIVTTPALAKSATPTDKTLLSSSNIYLAMSRINSKYFALPFLRKPFDGERIHPSATIHKTAKIAATAVLGPNVVIHQGVTIGERTFIGANTVIEANTSVGDDCFLHPQVYIGHTVRMGNRCEVKPQSSIGSDGFGYSHDEKGNHYRLPHYGPTIIEDDVHIGANVSLDRGTYDPSFIGMGTKIDNHCHLGHNVKIGRNCLITAGFISAGTVVVGDNCIFGGRASLNGGITITDNCLFGALSGITKDVPKSGKYAGYPAVDFKDSLRVQISMTKLPELRAKVAKIVKHLGLSESEDA